MANNSLKSKFNELVEVVRRYDSNANIKVFKEAFEFAKLAHADDKRLSGVPYVLHSLETAIILASWKMDTATVIAGILHDTVEHGAATKDDVEKKFGNEILSLIEGVTKVSQIKLKGKLKGAFVENLRKMFLAMAKDLRIVFIRLAERLDNLKSLEYLPVERRNNYAHDSIEIYAPLAERLGMWEIKTKIDDLAFPFAYPKEYKKINKLSATYYKDDEKRTSLMTEKITKGLRSEGVSAEIQTRKKGIYSLWDKLKRDEVNWNLKKIHDYVALRIITDEVSDCYVALGVVHKFYKPVPHLAISDFISVPKPNGYRSIHTKVFGPGGYIVEVQIRTIEMHRQAEFGAASHWAYSEAKARGVKDEILEKRGIVADSKRLEWIKELAKWQNEVKDDEEFLQAVKFDALSRRIFVFSPKGDVFDLPENATPVDYAYTVHTDLGGYIKAAKVDGKVVSLDYKLSNGQVVEIIKSKEKRKPSSDWLEFVVSTQARREINKELRRAAS
jgi:GTP diphosphokinase / guanosine-3',5'-bis(diphosphate) 3'-diphosphatase